MSGPPTRPVLDLIDRLKAPGLDEDAGTAAWADLVATATGVEWAQARSTVRAHPPRVASGPGLDLDAVLGQLDLWVAHLPGAGSYGEVPAALDRLADELYAGRRNAPSAAPVVARRRGPMIAAGIVGVLLVAVGAVAGGLLARGPDDGVAVGAPAAAGDASGDVGVGAGALGGGDFLTLADARAEQQGYLGAVQAQVDAALAAAGVSAATWTTTADAEADQSGLCEIYGPGLTAWQITRESAVPVDGAAARTVLASITAQAPTDPRVEVRTVRTPYASDVAISWPAGLGGAAAPGALPQVQSATEVRLGWAPDGEAALDAAPASVPGTLSLIARSPCATG